MPLESKGVDPRRAYLKELAARSARVWGSTPLPHCFSGELLVETRNSVYRLRDGVCYSATRGEQAPRGRAQLADYVGMRLVGWLVPQDANAGMTTQWRPGAYAVLWRPAMRPRERSAVALTSASTAFRQTRPSIPPPLPARARTSAAPPRPEARPSIPPPRPTVPSFVPLAPPSTTRLHMPDAPAACGRP